MHPTYSGIDHAFVPQFETPELLELLCLRTAEGIPELAYHDVTPADCPALRYEGLAEGEVGLSPFELLPPLAFEAMQTQSPAQSPGPGQATQTSSFSPDNSLDSVPEEERRCVRRGRRRRSSPSLSPSRSRSASPSSPSRSRSSSPDRSSSEAGECRKGPWAADEDRQLRRLVSRYGASGWAKLAQRVPGRSGKQCRDRWMNHICPSINRGPWTPAEDQTLLRHQALWGNAWCRIAKLLPNRPYTAIKNRWYGSLRFQSEKARRR